MYYDINEILKEELEAVNYMLSRAEKFTGKQEKMMTSRTKKETVYHRRFVVVDKDGNKRRHSEKIGNAQHPRVIEIKQNHYNAKLKEKLQKAKEALEAMIGIYEGYDIDTVDEELYEVYRDYTGLVNKDPIFMSAQEWSRRPYIRNRYPFGEGSNVASDGERLRSKSEVIIYDQLSFLGIQFQSDVEVYLKDETGAEIHKDADFVIGVVHGRKPILEHLGKLLDPEYMDKSMKKLQLYIRNGYTLNKDLFLTADDAHGKLNAYVTMQLIRTMILPKTTTRR